MEKREFVSQREEARFERVVSYLRAHRALFANQGSVVATWRTYQGKQLGPYFQVAFRDRGRQKWMYLGRSEALAERVRGVLAELHWRRDTRRPIRRARVQIRRALKRVKAELSKQLAVWGIELKGWEFRGVRKGLARYFQTRGLRLPCPRGGCYVPVPPAPT